MELHPVTKSLETTLLGGIAALTIAFAAPAFAQDVDPDKRDKTEMSETLDQAADDIDAVADELTDETKDMIDGVEDTLTNPDEAMPEKAKKDTWDADVETMTDTESPVTCPEGTVVQTDGSCMATGDWEPED